jgi:glycosyltransferase involved in cell wall biosynthesis
MDDPALREDLGRRGAEAVRTKFTTENMARSTLAVYEELREAGRAKWR